MRNDYRAGQADARPWGDWTVLDAGPGFCVKRIRVMPGGVLSLQSHRHRAEHWVVVSGTAQVTCDADIRTLGPDQAIYLRCGAVHRIANPGADELVFIEVQTGAELREDDIIRYADDYGRT